MSLRNTRPIVLYNDANNIITSSTHPDQGATLNTNCNSAQNTRVLPMFQGNADGRSLGGDWITDLAANTNAYLSAGFVGDTYLDSIVFSLYFQTSSDLDFGGWGDSSTILTEPICIAFTDATSWAAGLPLRNFFEFQTLGQLMDFGTFQLCREGDNVFLTVCHKFEGGLHMVKINGVVPHVELIIPAATSRNSGLAGRVDSGNCVSATMSIKYRAEEQYDELLKFTAVPP